MTLTRNCHLPSSTYIKSQIGLCCSDWQVGVTPESGFFFFLINRIHDQSWLLYSVYVVLCWINWRWWCSVLCLQIEDYDVVVSVLSARCRSLVSLDLWRCRSLSERGLAELVSGCSTLEELDLGWSSAFHSGSTLHGGSASFRHAARRLSRLRRLYLTANRNICDADLEHIATHCPVLEHLDILGEETH